MVLTTLCVIILWSIKNIKWIMWHFTILCLSLRYSYLNISYFPVLWHRNAIFSPSWWCWWFNSILVLKFSTVPKIGQCLCIGHFSSKNIYCLPQNEMAKFYELKVFLKPAALALAISHLVRSNSFSYDTCTENNYLFALLFTNN